LRLRHHGIDGHFPRWGVAAADAGQTAEAMVDLFIEGVAKRLPSPSPPQGQGDRV
jgi:hypothetical protein